MEGLRLTVTDSSTRHVYTDSFHKLKSIEIKPIDELVTLKMNVFSSQANFVSGASPIAVAGIQDIVINITGQDYSSFFRGRQDFTNKHAVEVLEEKAVAFLKTQNPNDPRFQGDSPFDYKNDGVIV